jgi:hypothetical protein
MATQSGYNATSAQTPNCFVETLSQQQLWYQQQSNALIKADGFYAGFCRNSFVHIQLLCDWFALRSIVFFDCSKKQPIQNQPERRKLIFYWMYLEGLGGGGTGCPILCLK